MTDKIYLVGFMASGKSTVGRALAGRLGWRAEDIDELIERRERRTISEIFAAQEQITLSRYVAAIGLYRALGGGWEEPQKLSTASPATPSPR